MEDNNADTTDDRFLFDINIKKVSESKNLDILISEWVKYEPMFDTEQEIKGKCICNRYIKYINYFYNKINGNIIMVGDTCKIKLRLKNTSETEDDNKYVKMIFSKCKGIYKNINDIMNYNTDVVQQVMDLITFDVELTNGIDNINKLIATLNNIISIKQILEKNIDFYDFIKGKIIILEERKQILEEKNKIDQENEHKEKEYENEKQKIKIQFEEGYYVNIKNIDKKTETCLLDYIKKNNNKYIQKFINIYKDNTYLYNKIKNILDYKLNCIEKFRIKAEEKKKIEEALIKQKLEIYFEQKKNTNLEKYIRIKLGQTYPIPDIETDFLPNGDNINRFKHLRFDFHSGDDIKNNKHIIDLFKEDFNNYNVVVHSWKGTLKVFIISNINYEKTNFWNFDNTYNDDDNLLIEKYIDLTGIGTVGIIKEIFYYILSKTKECVEQKKEEEKIFIEEKDNFDCNIDKPLLLRKFTNKDDKTEFSKDDIRKYFTK